MATQLTATRGPVMKQSSSTLHSAPRHFGTLLSKLIAPFARRYIAGTTLAQALDKLAQLKAEGFETTFDHLGESVTSPEEAKMATEQYVVMLRALKERGLDRNVSVKLTSIGLAIDENLAREHLAQIVHAAEESHGFVRVDMEGSDVTSTTLDIVRDTKKNRSTPVGTVLQAMLKRTPTDALELLRKETTIRLCKGAYKEPPETAYQDMSEIRHQFMALTKRLLTSGLYHGIATHDVQLITELKRFAREQKIPKDAFEFQMLLGIRSKVARQLVAEGWRVRIYVPFGRAWLPYMWRRLRERKENVWFFAQSIWQR